MKIRTQLLAAVVVVNSVIVLMAALLVPPLSAEREIEPVMRGGANQVSMAAVIDDAIVRMHLRALAAREALAQERDPADEVARLEQALGAAQGQLRFLAAENRAELQPLTQLLDEMAPSIHAATQPPLTVEHAERLVADTLLLLQLGGHVLGDVSRRESEQGVQGVLAWLDHLQGHLLLTLVIACCALLGSAAASVLVYRRLIRPLGVVSGGLQAVLAGRRPEKVLPESADEFGDIVRAIGKLQAQADMIHRIAFVDGGTGLPNRNSLDRALREVRRLRPIDGSHGLILFGFDSYARLHSGFGLRLAEASMQVAGERLRGLDRLPTTVYRIEPDILAVLVDRGTADEIGRADLKRVVATALSRMAQTAEIEGQQFRLAAAAGAAIYPDDARDAEEYLSVCLEAMRQARAEGAGHLRFGERGHTHRLRKHLALAEQIRSGLRDGQFMPYFQPIVDTSRGVVCGAEVLVRWRQPDGRVILPGEFIRVAEGSEVIREMTRAVLQQACTIARGWSDRGHDFSIAFNLSAKLLTADLLVLVREVLRETALPASQLVAEVTETALFENVDEAGHILRELRATGVQLGLDDFGTGYSSLSHLISFDVDRFKIDASLVRAAGQGGRAGEVIRAMAGFARRSGIEVVVEGVETAEDAERMRDLGCPIQQGFHYSRALAQEQFFDWVRQYHARSDAA